LIPYPNFAYVTIEALGSQDVFNQFYGCWMGRAVGDIQHFNLHLVPFGCCMPPFLRIGQ
jgi:hypothetical protein